MRSSDGYEKIVSEAALKFGTSYCCLEELSGGYQNLIYQYMNGETPNILRISNASTRTKKQIISELDFLFHVSDKGVSVSLPVKSTEGRFIEDVSLDGNLFHAVSFIKAPGRQIRYPEYLASTDLFTELGKTTALLHEASRNFPADLNNRINWIENYYILNFNRFVPDTGKRESLMKQLEVVGHLESEKIGFGLIHGDINVGNFYLDKGKITLFDFDECQNSRYVEDIAIQLFYTIYVFNDDSIETRTSKANEFMQHFLKGYRSVCHIGAKTLEIIPDYLILREMIVHVGLHRRWDFSSLNSWQADYYRDSSNRIKNREPILEYDVKWNDHD